MVYGVTDDPHVLLEVSEGQRFRPQIPPRRDAGTDILAVAPAGTRWAELVPRAAQELPSPEKSYLELPMTSTMTSKGQVTVP